MVVRCQMSSRLIKSGSETHRTRDPRERSLFERLFLVGYPTVAITSLMITAGVYWYAASYYAGRVGWYPHYRVLLTETGRQFGGVAFFGIFFGVALLIVDPESRERPMSWASLSFFLLVCYVTM